MTTKNSQIIGRLSSRIRANSERSSNSFCHFWQDDLLSINLPKVKTSEVGMPFLFMGLTILMFSEPKRKIHIFLYFKVHVL